MAVYTLLAKNFGQFQFWTKIVSKIKQSEIFKCPKFLQYSIKHVLSGQKHHIFNANIHGMARIQIRRLCSVILFITGKENICFFYGVSGCKTLKAHVKLSFLQILFQSNAWF